MLQSEEKILKILFTQHVPENYNFSVAEHNNREDIYKDEVVL